MAYEKFDIAQLFSVRKVCVPCIKPYFFTLCEKIVLYARKTGAKGRSSSTLFQKIVYAIRL